MVTPEYRILHGLTTLTNDLTDAPTAQSDDQFQDITALHDASAILSSPNKTPSPTATIPFPAPYQTRQSIIVQKRMLKHPKLQHIIPPQSTPRVPNEPAPCELDPRVQIQHNLP